MRVVHCKRDPYDVYVGRANPRNRLAASKWANPRGDWTASDYERFLKTNTALMAQLPELRGKVLACWCAPAGGLEVRRPFICHAQVLAFYANRPQPRRTALKALLVALLSLWRK